MAIITGGNISQDGETGLYIQTGDATLSGTGSAELSITAAGQLSITGAGTDITVTGVANASALFSVDVGTGAHLTLLGLADLNAASTFGIESGGTLTLGGTLQLSALQTIDFKNGTGTLELATPGANLLESIVNFAPGASILIDGDNFTAAQSSYSGGVLTLVGPSGTYQLPITSNATFAGEFFHVTDTAAGAVVTLSNDPLAGIPAAGSTITATGGFVTLLGAEVLVGNGTLSGSGTTAVTATLLSDLTVTGPGTAIDLTNLAAASAGTNITVTGGANLAIEALTGVSALSTYTIGDGSRLALGSAVALSALQTIDFQNGSGVLELAPNAVASISLLDNIINFGTSSAIVLDGKSFDPTQSSYSGGTLHLVGASGTEDIAIAPDAAFAGAYFHITPNGTGDTITLSGTADGGFPACYCAGTHVLTQSGEKRVEDLVIGDRLITLGGVARPLRWIGRRSYQGRFLTANRRLQPVLIRQGALADGVPHRDLWLSPMHAIYLDAILIPVRALVNGVSILQPMTARSVDYLHLELDEHTVLHAEGALAESFVDDESRGEFQNAATYQELYPQSIATPALYCADRLDAGFVVERVRTRLIARCRHQRERAASQAALWSEAGGAVAA